jgi:proteic killer suppression protein
MRYTCEVIISFKCAKTEKIWNGRFSKKLPQNIQHASLRKLRVLNNAKKLDDLRIPPNNRLEPLKGNRKGQYSIRINRQWRICFKWIRGHAEDVEIVDYH